MFVNDLESVYCEKDISGIDIDSFKVFIILYAADIVLFGNTAKELQENLFILEEYCNRWKLVVNTNKTKIMIFRKGGRLPINISFK